MAEGGKRSTRQEGYSMNQQITEHGSGYKRTRVRGLAPWQPRASTRAVLDQIQDVLEEYREQWPITNRQICYRLVGRFGYDKSEQAFERAYEYLNRGRRAGLVPFEAIRDDGEEVAEPLAFASREQFIATARRLAADYRMDRQTGQAQYIELWCEAAGMVPQLAAVVGEYGIPVRSSSGFNSVTVLHDAARRVLEREVPTLVFQVGDHDPSGRAILDRVAADVTQLAYDLAIRDDHHRYPEVSFERIAVTENQIGFYQLPGAPPKATDKRGTWEGDTVQAEALAPDVLATEVRLAVTSLINGTALDEVRRQEAIEGDRVAADIEALLEADDD
jgi:hypothetical protein